MATAYQFIFRTKLCNCQSDAEFLAKLYCLRLAFTVSMAF